MSVAEFRMQLKSESSPALLFLRREQANPMNQFTQNDAAFPPFETGEQGEFACGDAR